jgi:23S rRNA (adenine2503-C2)-methyltransferase
MTALMGLERNLTAGEIVGQVLFVARENGLLDERDTSGSRLNIVMMGMGEPLLNLESVLKATRILVDPRGVGLSEKRITLSTAGIVPKIAELGREHTAEAGGFAQRVDRGDAAGTDAHHAQVPP